MCACGGDDDGIHIDETMGNGKGYGNARCGCYGLKYLRKSFPFAFPRRFNRVGIVSFVLEEEGIHAICVTQCRRRRRIVEWIWIDMGRDCYHRFETIIIIIKMITKEWINKFNKLHFVRNAFSRAARYLRVCVCARCQSVLLR